MRCRGAHFKIGSRIDVLWWGALATALRPSISSSFWARRGLDSRITLNPTKTAEPVRMRFDCHLIRIT